MAVLDTVKYAAPDTNGMSFADLIRTLPVPICGLALGLASLDRFLVNNYDYDHYIFVIISAAIFVMFTIRVLIDRKGVKKELENPAVIGVLPTYCMTLMILSTYVHDHSEIAGQALWLFAIVLSFIIMLYFLVEFIPGSGIDKVYPSWFVLFVGYVVGSMTAPDIGMVSIGKIIFVAGLTGYFALSIPILYRVVKLGIPRPALPNLAIFAAPMNLCVAGYFASYAGDLNETLIAVMTIFAVGSYAAVLCCMPVLLRTEFYPSFAAFTFPMVISSVSLHLLFVHYGITGTFADIVLIASALFAAFIVVYVLIRYVMFLYVARRRPEGMC